MSAELSLQQILASLEARIAFHREREAAAARQEAVFREQRAAPRRRVGGADAEPLR